MALLGLAGGTAASVAGWISPILIGVTVIFLGRAHYVLHVLKQGNRLSSILTWTTTAAVLGFWTWRLAACP
ncbi:MAG: hypothetical protein N2C14_05960 [Planctomycetales bacterium]